MARMLCLPKDAVHGEDAVPGEHERQPGDLLAINSAPVPIHPLQTLRAAWAAKRTTAAGWGACALTSWGGAKARATRATSLRPARWVLRWNVVAVVVHISGSEGGWFDCDL